MSPVLAPGDSLVSPSELLMIFLNEEMDRAIVPAGAVVGGADDEQQQAGCVALMDAGNAKNELYTPLFWKRVQVRCMHNQLSAVDTIGNHVNDLLHEQQYLVMTDASGKQWFVHSIFVSTGPSHHIDSSETYESLLFATICVGRDPIPDPGP